MSYIVPKEKPKCYNCPFRTLDYCGLLIEHDRVTVNVNKMTASEYCPLVDIPTPHGRLIDATFEENHYASVLLNPTPDVTEQDKYKARIIIEALRMAGTVIEAEGREHD